MNILSIKYIIALFLLLWLQGGAAFCGQSTSNIQTLIEVKSDQDIHDNSIEQNYYFSLTGNKININSNGIMVVTNDESKNIARITFFKDDEMYITRLFYVLYNSDLVLAYETEDSEGGCARMIRLKIGSWRKIWNIKFGFFNLGEIITIEDNFIYVTTFNYVGKYDIDNGKLIWKDAHNFSEIYKINYFENIRIKDSEVDFLGVIIKDGTKCDSLLLKYNKITGHKIE